MTEPRRIRDLLEYAPKMLFFQKVDKKCSKILSFGAFQTRYTCFLTTQFIANRNHVSLITVVLG